MAPTTRRVNKKAVSKKTKVAARKTRKQVHARSEESTRKGEETDATSEEELRKTLTEEISLVGYVRFD